MAQAPALNRLDLLLSWLSKRPKSWASIFESSTSPTTTRSLSSTRTLKSKKHCSLETAPDQTFYEGQLKVLFEDVYFHWVTTRALRQLVSKGKLATDLVVSKPFAIRFYRSPRWQGRSIVQW